MSDDKFPELRVQAEIKKAEDDLVQWIENALDDRQSYGDLEESQFRNAVQVAASSSSPKVVQNFLRYQMGRDKKWGRGNHALASRIIKDIDDSLHAKARSIHKVVYGMEQGDHLQDIWMQLIRRYLGYGSRHLKYRNEIQ